MLGINGTILGRRPSGLGIYAKNIIEELDRRGIDFILYSSFVEDLKLSDKNRKRIHKIGFSVEPLDQVKHFLRILWLQIVFPWRLKRDGISILLNLVPEGPFFTQIIQVTVVHDLIPILSKRSHFLQKLNFRIFVPWLLDRSKSVVTNSQATKDDLIRFFKIKDEKIHPIHIAFDEQRFKPSHGQEAKRKFVLDRYFLYVGNILPHKNLALLIEAFRRAALGAEYHLVIVGHQDRRYFPFLRDSIKRNSLKDRVVFLDYVANSDLPLLMSHAEALVLPSFFEGFGLTPLEAMACGCPVVASDLPSVREVCADAIKYFNPNDPDELGGILKNISRDVHLRFSLKEKGLERSKCFSWGKCAINLINVIESK